MAGIPRECQRRVGAFAAIAAFTVLSSGVAYADTGQDPGPNRNHPGRPGTAVDAAKLEAMAREEAKKLARDEAKELAEAAAAIDDFAASDSFPTSRAVQEAALGPGGPVPTIGMGGLVPNARALAAYIANTYPGVQSIGGVRSDPLPDHPSGHAIDIMIGWDMSLGDVISADVRSQAGRFGVAYTLWRVPNHFNHVHVTVF